MTPTMQETFFRFLDEGKSPWHVAESLAQALSKNGFRHLDMKDSFSLAANGRYYIRKGGTVIAFTLPASLPSRLLFAASHTDSPTLKIKPKPSFSKGTYGMLSAEVYGSPVLASFLNRECGIAGRVFFEASDGSLESKLIDLSEYPVIIPHLAIHLDRELNEKGPQINPETHLYLLATAKDGDQFNFPELLSKHFSLPRIISHDLVIYPLEKARAIGIDADLFASARIDNLGSVFTMLKGFEESLEGEKALKIAFFFNNEEIGSETSEGAGSPLFMELLERIRLSLSLEADWLYRLRHNSFGLSVDEAHATHPNFSNRHDERHEIKLGGGVVIKHNAKMRYATSGKAVASLKLLSKKLGMNLQEFVSRNDIPCGSTIGPILASGSGFELVDIGCPELSMHGAREIGSLSDHAMMIRLIGRYFSESAHTENV